MSWEEAYYINPPAKFSLNPVSYQKLKQILWISLFSRLLNAIHSILRMHTSLEQARLLFVRERFSLKSAKRDARTVKKEDAN